MRHYYRCQDCLTVAATDEQLPELWDDTRHTIQYATCDACGGRIEYLGRVQGAMLHSVVGYVCACDARCTNAAGPSCDCACKGENHGSGRVVPVYRDSAIPRLGMPKDAAKKAQEFRDLCAQYREKWDGLYGHLVQSRRNGEWLPRHLFDRLVRGQREYANFQHATGLRTHTGRIKAITKLIAGVSTAVCA